MNKKYIKTNFEYNMHLIDEYNKIKNDKSMIKRCYQK